MRWRAAWTLVLVLGACGQEASTATEVIVEITAEDEVMELADRLRVHVEGRDGLDALRGSVERYEETLDGIPLPKRIALVPLKGDAKRAFVLTATALDADGQLLAEARLISGFMPNQVRFGRLVIQGGECLRRACEDLDTTCNVGRCVSAVVEVKSLSSDSNQPRQPDYEGGGAPATAVYPDAGDEPEDEPDGSVSGVCEDDARCDPEPPALRDQCADQSDDCDADPDACRDTSAGYECVCPTGYEGSGRGPDGCTNRDECALGVTAACGVGATRCNDLPGSFSCECGGEYVSASTTACRSRAWSQPVSVESEDQTASAPTLGLDAEGNALAVWFQNGRVLARQFIAVEGWVGEAVALDDAKISHGLDVAFDAAGNAAAVWIDRSMPDAKVVAARFGKGVGWSKSQVLVQQGGLYVPSVAMGGLGHAVAVWEQMDLKRTAERAAACVFSGGSWGKVAMVDASSSVAFTPQVEVDGGGNAIVVWRDSNANLGVMANRFTVGAGWGTPVSIHKPLSPFLQSPRLAIDVAGNATAVWVNLTTGAPNSIAASRYDTTTGWDEATLIEASNEPASSPDVAADGTGGAFVVWSQKGAAYQSIWANRFARGTGWGSAVLLEQDDAGDALAPQVAADAAGNAIAVWAQGDGTRTNLWAARYVVGRGWNAPVLLEDDDRGNAGLPQVSMNARGEAMVIWSQHDGTRSNVLAARFD
ncbi:MAG TPA: calcium-binding EGF-like domain-containing protein [Polyangiales bacterium]